MPGMWLGAPQSLEFACCLRCGHEYQFPCQVPANIWMGLLAAVEMHPSSSRGAWAPGLHQLPLHRDAGGTGRGTSEWQGARKQHMHAWEGCVLGTPTHCDRAAEVAREWAE